MRDVIDASGGVVDHIVYDSFGNIASRTSSTYDLRFGYTGRELASEAGDGLYYNRRRFYDATVGRFITQDPSGFNAGDVNLYRYVSNSPLIFTDPTGFVQESVIGADALFAMGLDQEMVELFLEAQADQMTEISDYYAEQLALENSSLYRLQGSGSILANSFFGTDSLGLTDSTQYQSAGFDAARVAANTASFAFVGVTFGASSALHAGRAGAFVARTAPGIRLFEAAEAGLNIGASFNEFSRGNISSGFYRAAFGGLGASSLSPGRIGSALNRADVGAAVGRAGRTAQDAATTAQTTRIATGIDQFRPSSNLRKSAGLEATGRQARKLLAEAAEAAGVKYGNLVDDVVAGSVDSFKVRNGRRILTLSQETLLDERIGQRLLVAGHELVHAQSFAKTGVIPKVGTRAYAAGEYVAERLARIRTREYLGRLSESVEQGSIEYSQQALDLLKLWNRNT